MSDFLFSEFPEMSEKQWKQLIQYELQGADYNDTLVWESPEGVKVQPFYHGDSYEQAHIDMPERDFEIGKNLFIADAVIAGTLAKKFLDRGADLIEFSVERAYHSGRLFSHIPENSNIHFYFSVPYLNIMEETARMAGPYRVRIYSDILGNVVRYGDWMENEETDFHKTKTISAKFPGIYSPMVNAGHFHNAGANIVQQVAYALSQAWEYLHRVPGVTHIRLHFAQGSNYFFEIAKLRAVRYLWQLLQKEHPSIPDIEITARPGLRNKTLYDAHVNMLRTASEVMSAVLGGADRVFDLAFDMFYSRSSDFSNRIALNQLILLREENGFRKPQHYAEGSYYIEKLTLEIAKRALEIFQHTESKGGFLQLLKKGEIQRQIKKNAAKEQQLFDEGKIILLGTNKYPKANEKISKYIHFYPFVKRLNRKTAMEALTPVRLSEKMEKERYRNEKKSNKTTS